jgi:cytochrome P450
MSSAGERPPTAGGSVLGRNVPGPRGWHSRRLRIRRPRPPYPPGPKGLPLVFSLLAHWKDPLGFLMKLAREYGDVVHFRAGWEHVFFLRHPDAIKIVLVTRQDSFEKGLTARWSKQYLGEGLLTSEGQSHHRQRRMIQPAFHRTRLTAYARVMSAFADEMGDGWRDGATLEVAEEMRRLTLAIVGQTLFGADLAGAARRVGESLAAIHRLSTLTYRSVLPFGRRLGRLPLPGHLRLRKAVARLDEIVYPLIEERRRDCSERQDLLSMLLQARDEEANGRAMTDVQVRDEITTLFLAGHETTANALTWTWYLLAQYPDVEARLHRELATVLGARAPTVEDLPRLVYTQSVLSESVRLYPPAFALGRRALHDVSVGDWVIPAGSLVSVSQFVTQRDPRFFPDPLRFDPDRWTSEGRAGRPEFAYFPFGGGARRCVGEQFALIEGVLILASLARRWRLRPLPGERVEMRPLVVLKPVGLQMQLERLRS